MARKKRNVEPSILPNDACPYRVPANWGWVQQGSVCQLVNGEKAEGKDLPYLEAKYLRGQIEGKIVSSGKLVEKGAKVILVDGENSGEVFDIPEDGYMGSTFKQLGIASTVDPDYLKYFISTKKDLYRNRKKGSAIPHLNKDLFFEMPIPVAPYPEQKRIVERLNGLIRKIDTALDNLESIEESSADRKNAIFFDAFQGKLTKEWRLANIGTGISAITAIAQDAEEWPKKEQKYIYECQKNCIVEIKEKNNVWTSCNVGSIGKVFNGSTPSRSNASYWNGNIPWVSSGEVKNNIITGTEEAITQEGFENTSIRILPAGTVLIAMIGEGKTRGQSAVLEISATINQNIAAVVTDPRYIAPRYLWYWFQYNYTKNRTVGGGSGPQALNCQRVRELDFKFPELQEQKEIVRILDDLISKEDQLVESMNVVIEQAQILKKSVINDAFHAGLGTNIPSESPVFYE